MVLGGNVEVPVGGVVLHGGLVGGLPLAVVPVRPVHSQRFQLLDLGVGQHTFVYKQHADCPASTPSAMTVRRDILDGNFQRVMFQIILDGGGIALLPEDAAGVPHHAQCLEALDAV